MAGGGKRGRGRLFLRLPRAEHLAGDAPAPDGFIYFLASSYVVDGAPVRAVKIGHSASLFAVNARVTCLQIGNPDPLDLIAVIAGSRGEEDALHALLHPHWIRGEWYLLAPARRLLPYL